MIFKYAILTNDYIVHNNMLSPNTSILLLLVHKHVVSMPLGNTCQLPINGHWCVWMLIYSRQFSDIIIYWCESTLINIKWSSPHPTHLHPSISFSFYPSFLPFMFFLLDPIRQSIFLLLFLSLMLNPLCQSILLLPFLSIMFDPICQSIFLLPFLSFMFDPICQSFVWQLIFFFFPFCPFFMLDSPG